jgi:hypothetical protein
MNDRDERILTHVGLYQITLRRVIEELFFDQGNCGNVLQRLVTSKQLQVRDGLPGRVSYYQLTRTVAKRRGLPESRARAPQNQSLHTSLGVLWFCTMSETSRHRIENSQVEKLFPVQAPVAIHCIEQSPESHRLIRIKVVDPNSDDGTILRSVRKTVFQTTNLPGLRPWIQTGRYAFAILAETESRVERIRQIIQADQQLSETATFIVEQAPGVRTLNKALHDRQHRTTQQQIRFASAEEAQ